MNGLEMGFSNANQDPGLLLRHWLDLGPNGEGYMNAGCQDSPRRGSEIQESRDIIFQGSESAGRRDAGKSYHCTGCSRDVNPIVEDNQTATVHREIQKGHIKMVKKLLEKGGNDKPDGRGWTQKGLAEQGNKGIYDLILSYENRRPAGEHKIDIGPETAHDWDDEGKCIRNEGPHNSKSRLQKLSSNSSSSNSEVPRDRKTAKVNKKRVTIHMKSQSKDTLPGKQKPLGKLIVLPDSIEELLRLAGKLY